MLIEIPAHSTSSPAAAIEIEPNCGHTYQVMAQSMAQRQEVLRQLFMNRKVGLVSADGGTISNLSGWENILLPAQYFSATDEARELWKTERFLEQAEIDEQSIRHMLLTPASQLSLFERKMIGFARAMQMKPELLILDMIFENMTEIECATLRKLNGIFHLHFPFRTAIFLDVHQTHDNVKADRVFYI